MSFFFAVAIVEDVRGVLVAGPCCPLHFVCLASFEKMQFTVLGRRPMRIRELRPAIAKGLRCLLTLVGLVDERSKLGSDAFASAAHCGFPQARAPVTAHYNRHVLARGSSLASNVTDGNPRRLHQACVSSGSCAPNDPLQLIENEILLKQSQSWTFSSLLWPRPWLRARLSRTRLAIRSTWTNLFGHFIMAQEE